MISQSAVTCGSTAPGRAVHPVLSLTILKNLIKFQFLDYLIIYKPVIFSFRFRGLHCPALSAAEFTSETVNSSKQLAIILSSAQRSVFFSKIKGKGHPITGHEGPEGE